jgi:hypothetical protein
MPDSIPLQFEFNQDGIRSFFTKEKIFPAPSQIGLPINHQFSEKRFADFSTVRYSTMKAMKKDKGIVLTVVTQNGYALKFADETLKNDKVLALAAVT